MNRLASAMLVLGLAAGPAGVACAAQSDAAPSSGTTAPAAHSAPAMPTAHHQRSDAEGDRMTHALNLLEGNGYGDFSNFRQSGKDFTATVTQNGQPFTVLVDPDTGRINHQG